LLLTARVGSRQPGVNKRILKSNTKGRELLNIPKGKSIQAFFLGYPSIKYTNKNVGISLGISFI
jgi:hypothetical protein